MAIWRVLLRTKVTDITIPTPKIQPSLNCVLKKSLVIHHPFLAFLSLSHNCGVRVHTSILTSVFLSFLALCRCFVSVQQPINDKEGSFPHANRGQHTNQRLPHNAQRPLLLRYTFSFSFTSVPLKNTDGVC